MGRGLYGVAACAVHDALCQRHTRPETFRGSSLQGSMYSPIRLRNIRGMLPPAISNITQAAAFLLPKIGAKPA